MSGFAPKGVKVNALLFDKDGTLFDFQSTWGVWAEILIEEMSGGDPGRADHLVQLMQYDRESRSFHPESSMIADTHLECAETIAPALSHMTIDQIAQRMTELADDVPLAPAVALPEFLSDLAGRGLRLGVMTNDTEAGAHSHLSAAGVLHQFDFVAGFDSGFGAKPAPDPLLAFARAVSIDPAQVAMVGDSPHDLIAGRAAGMQTIGVLTGPASAADLAPLADVVLPDIGHIPSWLEA